MEAKKEWVERPVIYESGTRDPSATSLGVGEHLACLPADEAWVKFVIRKFPDR
jgi:hypothetical protein